jgi:hypothetical protein
MEGSEARAGVGERVKRESVQQAGQVQDDLFRAHGCSPSQVGRHHADGLVRDGDEHDARAPDVLRATLATQHRDLDASVLQREPQPSTHASRPDDRHRALTDHEPTPARVRHSANGKGGLHGKQAPFDAHRVTFEIHAPARIDRTTA